MEHMEPEQIELPNHDDDDDDVYNGQRAYRRKERLSRYCLEIGHDHLQNSYLFTIQSRLII